jgi:hypothetical protein
MIKERKKKMKSSFRKSFTLILAALVLLINVVSVVPAHAAFGPVDSLPSSEIGMFHHGSRPPTAPIVNKPPSFTNDTTPIIGGKAEEGTRVNVWYLDDLGVPIQICKNILVDEDDDREVENGDWEHEFGNWSCTSSKVLPERKIELVVNATDKEGHKSADTSYFFTIDTTPPTVSSIIRASANPTSDPSVNYTVTFSESVVDVDSSDFTIDVTGTLSGATVSNVVGSGNTYTVTVDTGSGSGTLRLDIPVTATVNDMAGNPLGGLPYISGEVYTVAQNIVPTYEAETIGVFQPSGVAWYLRNSNSSGAPDYSTNFGLPSDYPIVGDWDGNGTDTIGVYRNGVFYLSNSNTLSTADIVFAFGAPGDQPVAGDWNGDGIDTVGIYRSSTITFYLRNSNSTGAPDISFLYGSPGDVGVAGDWDGDGIDTIGVYRPSNGLWYLRNTNSTGVADVAFDYGLLGDKPVMADWNNDGIDTVGVYRNNTFYLRNANSSGFADLVFAFGSPGDLPVAGNWDGLP